MIKLLVTDMDGTLLDDDKNFPSEFLQIEKKLQEKGIQFAVASGRQYYNILEIFDSIKEHCIFIAENGTLVMLNNECLHLEPLQQEEVEELIAIGRKIDNADVIYCGLKSAYIEHDNPELWKYAKKYYKNLQLVQSLNDVKDDCLKITINDFANAKDNSYQHFKALENKYKVAISGRVWLDITNKNANKGKALKGIQERLNISYDETMVFGDFLNDLEMMQNAKYSFAMKNAEPEIVAASNFQTEFTNNENGVIRTIKKFIFNSEE